MRRVGLVLAVVAVVMVVLAQPAGATFPGKVGRIAYTGGANQIATVKPDGTGVKVLTSFPTGAYAEASQYSANGKWIVFDALVVGQWDIWKMRQDGSRLKQLTNDANDDLVPSWSPDGKKIVFARDAGWIWVMNADGTHAHQLTVGSGSFPRYSPDGKEIAYQSYADSEIHVMKADGSSDHAITSNAFSDGFPDWSPDGKKIAFMSDRSGSAQAWVMEADGSHPVQVTTVPASGAMGAPEFSPNGKKIADWDSNNSFVVNLDGTKYHVVGATTSCCVGWQPLPKR